MTMQKGIFVLAAAFGYISHAEKVELRPLVKGDGQIMVHREFSRCPFEKGSFGNEVSLLLPFSWTVKDKAAYTYFSAADQRYSDGISWEVRQILDGEMIVPEHGLTQGTDAWFLPSHLFEVKWDDGYSDVLYHHDNYGSASLKDGGEKIFLVNSIWYELSVETNGLPKKFIVDGGVRSFLKNNEVTGICNVIPHRYLGADAKVVREQSDSQKRLEMCSRQAWSLSMVQKEQIAVLHREYVEKSHPGGVVTNVYIIAGDGNFDGACDAYVSTDLEKSGTKNYVWTLYLADRTRFSRAKEVCERTFGRIETVYVDAEVCASRDSFFRFDRIRMPSYIMPVVFDKGKIELWDYVSHDSGVRALRRQNGLSNAMFGDCISPSGMGVASLDDLFSGFAPLVRMNRIQCETFGISRRNAQ